MLDYVVQAEAYLNLSFRYANEQFRVSERYARFKEGLRQNPVAATLLFLNELVFVEDVKALKASQNSNNVTDAKIKDVDCQAFGLKHRTISKVSR